MSRALGHESAHRQLPRLDAQLAGATADSANVLLARAALLLELGNPQAARADLESALRLSTPGDPAPRLALASLELTEGNPDRALSLLEGESSLAHSPAGWFLRAEALRARGETEAAHAAARRGLELRASARAEEYLLVSGLAREAGNPTASLAVLETGIARLGPVPSLAEAAFAVDLERGAYESALHRLDAQDPDRVRPDLLSRRGDLLLTLGRVPEAWAAFTEARTALDRLPPSRRDTPDAQALSAHLDRVLRPPEPRGRP